MRVRVLGAHNLATPHTRLPALLLEGGVALDAGGLANGLALEEQAGLSAVLLTHRHYDHLRDLPILGLATLECGRTLPVYGSGDTLDHLHRLLMDGSLYPDFTQRPHPEAPRFRLVRIAAMVPFEVEGYRVRAVPVPHSVPALGYEVHGPDGRTLFYTGDATAGLADALACLDPAPDLLAVETTFPDRLEERARNSAHLTPSLLGRELRALQKRGRPLPRRVLALHLHPGMAEEIREDLARMEAEVGVPVLPGREDLEVEV